MTFAWRHGILGLKLLAEGGLCQHFDDSLPELCTDEQRPRSHLVPTESKMRIRTKNYPGLGRKL